MSDQPMEERVQYDAKNRDIIPEWALGRFKKANATQRTWFKEDHSYLSGQYIKVMRPVKETLTLDKTGETIVVFDYTK